MPQLTRPTRSRWTWNLGRIAGIPLRVHVTLVLLLAWIVMDYAVRGAGLATSAIGLALVVCVFVVIVVHELGHALVARHFGIATRDIMLLPIGGISSLERMPERPSQELAVALVGPAINLVLAGLLWLGISLVGGPTDMRVATSFGGEFATQLLWINVMLALFNLIPAFPMDGGRALRALLALRMTRERATDIAATLGKGFAVLIVAVGVFYNPLMILIGVVVWLGASQERALVHLHAALHGVPVSAAMLTRVRAVAPDDLLGHAAALLLEGRNELPVIDHGEPVGVLTRDDVATGLASVGPDAPIARAPHHDAVTVSPAEPLDSVLDLLRERHASAAVVIDHGVPVGLITADALTSYAALHRPA